MRPERRLRILTWHVHGSYLEALGSLGHELLVPWRPGRPEGYAGRPPDAAHWPDSIVQVDAEAVRGLDVDVVLFQSRRNWELDAEAILSTAQRRGPRIYLEHDPPREHPTDTRHWVDDPDVLLVHVTAFNDLMWDRGRTPARVIEHGVAVPDDVRWTGDLGRGIAVVNNLDRRGRRLGADLFEAARPVVPLDLAGMGSERMGGLGAVSRRELYDLLAPYRFYFHPIRWTSFGMAACEAMLIGLPVVALATTEMPTVLRDGETGFLDTSLERLIERMRALLEDRSLAERLGAAGREMARERFGMERFARDWNAALADVTGRTVPTSAAGVATGSAA